MDSLLFPGMLYRSSGHFWIWGLPTQQFWTILYQLCKWKIAVLLQQACLQAWTGEFVGKWFDTFTRLWFNGEMPHQYFRRQTSGKIRFTTV